MGVGKGWWGLVGVGRGWWGLVGVGRGWWGLVGVGGGWWPVDPTLIVGNPSQLSFWFFKGCKPLVSYYIYRYLDLRFAG